MTVLLSDTGMPDGAEDLVRRVLDAIPAIRAEVLHGSGRVQVIPGSDVVPMGVYHLLDTGRCNDEPSVSREERGTRCFELSCWAVVAGKVAPESSRLVHGSIHGRSEEMRRIAHGWVVLPGGLLWEPINALIHDAAEFIRVARAWDEVSYTPKQAAINLLRTEHYGSWHDSRYPTKSPDESQEEAEARHGRRD